MWASFSVTFLLNAVQWYSSFVSGSSTKSTYHTLCRGSAYTLRATKGLISPNVPHWLGWTSQEKERLICYVKNSGRSSVRTDDWCVPCSFVVCPNVYCSGWNGRCLLLFALYILLKNVLNILGHVKFILNNSTCARTNVTNQELSSLFCRKMKNPYIILHSSISKGLLRASPGACGDITNRARGPNMTLPRILNHQAGEKHLTERKHRSLRFFNVCPGNVRDEDIVWRATCIKHEQIGSEVNSEHCLGEQTKYEVCVWFMTL